ncbi:MAG: class IV adenylate cyclase [Pirellulales bacterium]
MKLEVEQKFAVPDLGQLQTRLLELGAKAGEPQLQVDQYFAHPSRDFAQTDEALRIRRIGQGNFVTYKGPKIDATTKTRRELELPLADGSQAAGDFGQLLVALGFRPVAVVSKQRQPMALEWQGLEVAVALDQVENLGTFIELELESDESQLPAARQALASLAAQLGLTSGERRSYLELLLGP